MSFYLQALASSATFQLAAAAITQLHMDPDSNHPLHKDDLRKNCAAAITQLQTQAAAITQLHMDSDSQPLLKDGLRKGDCAPQAVPIPPGSEITFPGFEHLQATVAATDECNVEVLLRFEDQVPLSMMGTASGAQSQRWSEGKEDKFESRFDLEDHMFDILSAHVIRVEEDDTQKKEGAAALDDITAEWKKTVEEAQKCGLDVSEIEESQTTNDSTRKNDPTIRARKVTEFQDDINSFTDLKPVLTCMQPAAEYEKMREFSLTPGVKNFILVKIALELIQEDPGNPGCFKIVLTPEEESAVGEEEAEVVEDVVVSQKSPNADSKKVRFADAMKVRPIPMSNFSYEQPKPKNFQVKEPQWQQADGRWGYSITFDGEETFATYPQLEEFAIAIEKRDVPDKSRSFAFPPSTCVPEWFHNWSFLWCKSIVSKRTAAFDQWFKVHVNAEKYGNEFKIRVMGKDREEIEQEAFLRGQAESNEFDYDILLPQEMSPPQKPKSPVHSAIPLLKLAALSAEPKLSTAAF